MPISSNPIARAGALLLLLLLLAGCDRAVRPSGPLPRQVSVALEQIGVPYRYGGESPRGFDCSGLVFYSFRQAGLTVPRSTDQQFARAQPIEMSQAKPGDLLFFTLGKKLGHVGIYVGERRFVHAPSTGKRVELTSLDDPYWRQRFLRAGRV